MNGRDVISYGLGALSMLLFLLLIGARYRVEKVTFHSGDFIADQVVVVDRLSGRAYYAGENSSTSDCSVVSNQQDHNH